jgi:hypothetical protein
MNEDFRKPLLKRLLVPLTDFAADLKSIRREEVRHLGNYVLVALGVLAVCYLVCLVYARTSAWGTAGQPLRTELVRASGKATNLIAVVHHYKGSAQKMADVRAALTDARPNSDILITEFPASTFSNGDCFQLSEQLCQALNGLWSSNSYGGVELVGYSMGALLARKAYVYGWGRVEDLNPNRDAPTTNRPPQAWVTNTTRFVLLAGMNRGWTTRTRPNGMGLGTWLLFKVGKVIGVTTGTGRLILQCEAGEPFVSNLRMQWLDVYRTTQPHFPLMIQLLGDNDNLVTREDERDVSVAKDFVWVQLSGTEHGNAAEFHGRRSIWMKEKAERLSAFYAAQRREKFVQALGGVTEIERLRRASPQVPSAEDPNVVAGVVVLHGIRDLGNEWTSQFEEALQARFAISHPPSQKLCIYRPTYGYFDMISFLRWPERQAKVRWFMDELTELQAKYPNMTNLHFIGHSHGTYVLGSALRKYKALKLDRAVFAGSVVPQYYDWASPALTNRIRAVRNYVASSDKVVAWLPRLFELFHGDLGSAGFNGFQRPPTFAAASWTNFMKQTKYIIGAHSAAIQRGDTNMIGSIADFVIHGDNTKPARTTDIQPWWIQAGSHPLGCLTVWVGLVAILTLIGIYVTWWLRRLMPYAFRAGFLFRNRPFAARLLGWGIYLVGIWHLLKLA